jgi:hypothetical protein
MMFIIRSAGDKPAPTGVEIKLVRKTPATVSNASGKLDFFCTGEAAATAALRAAGWEVVELRDGWYEDDSGGGVAISGHGRYWEVRDTPFTIKEAVGPAGEVTASSNAEGEVVNVRRAIFGV